MGGWVIQPEVTAEEWEDQTIGDDGNDWTIKASIMNPNASANKSILHSENWVAEEYNVFPENDEIFPEESQADQSEWTILSQETD